MQSMPEPTTKTALLPNANGNPTIHLYVRTELVEPDPDVPGDRPSFAFIYECIDTGAQRRWGLQSMPRGRR